ETTKATLDAMQKKLEEAYATAGLGDEEQMPPPPAPPASKRKPKGRRKLDESSMPEREGRPRRPGDGGARRGGRGRGDRRRRQLDLEVPSRLDGPLRQREAHLPRDQGARRHGDDARHGGDAADDHRAL